MKAAFWMLVPLLLFLTGCEQWNKLFLDDAGQPAIEQQEFSWFLINVFRLVFDDPLRFIGTAIGIFLLLAVGGALWPKAGSGICSVSSWWWWGRCLRLPPEHGLFRHGHGLGRHFKLGQKGLSTE